MKNFLRKALAIGCTVALTTGTFSAVAAAEKINLASKSDVDKPQKITLMADWTFLAEDNGLTEVLEKYKELTGITLEINRVAQAEYQNVVNVAFTAGTVPDAMLLDAILYSKYATNGALADLTALYETSQAKENIVDQAYIDALKLDGKLYGLPQVSGNGTVTYVRGDWLEELGMDIPTTYNEFLEMLRAFRDSDLDGNGKNDTIAYTAPGLINNEVPLDMYPREFYQNANPDFVLKDGKYVDGMLELDMRYALTRMTSAFEEGLIDKEVLTNGTTTARDRFSAGNVGVFNYWKGLWNKNLQDRVTKNVPTAQVLAIPAIENVSYIERVSNPISIYYKCKNIDGVFKYLLEFMLDEGEGQHLFTYGVEDVTYTMEDGKLTFKKQKTSPTTDYSKSYMDAMLSITNFKDVVERESIIYDSIEAFNSKVQYKTIFPPSMAYSTYISDLNNIRSKYINMIVYGDVSLDDGLTGYAAESKNYVDRILADFNK